MHLPKFDYLEPQTILETCQLLKTYQGESMIIAGGSDLIVAMKQRLKTPKYLICLKKVASMKGIAEEKGELIIGPLTTLQEIVDSATVQEKMPILVQAAREVGSPLIRSIATIGGNLCLDNRCRYYNQSEFWRKANQPCLKVGGHKCLITNRTDRCNATFSSDVAPALIALEAEVTLNTSESERTISLADFYTGESTKPNQAAGGGMFLSKIQIPLPSKGLRGIYRKHRKRQSIDFPIVGLAGTMELAGGVCQKAQFVFTGVGSGPIIADTAVNKLLGQRLTSEVIADCALEAMAGIRPFKTDLTTPAYKRNMVQLLIAETIKELGGISG